MSISQTIGGDVNPSATLRRIAEIATNPEVKALANQLAAELEAQHNRQNNAWQAALGNAELGIENQIDQIVKRLDTSDARQQTMLEMLEQLQIDIRALQARELGGDDAAAG